MDSDMRQKCTDMVSSHKVVLFMKGDRSRPNCGFSARVIGMLEELEIGYQTFDVLSDPVIRSGMKEFTNWPTFPQLYIDQEFVGGCDIITEMNQNGELATTLGVTIEEVLPPKIECSEAFLNVIRASLQKHDGGVHLEISKDFQYDIGIGPKQPGDLEVVIDGISFYFNRGAAKRANGIKLDYHSGPEGGVDIQNPNEPEVGELSVQQLKTWLDESKELTIFDVRRDDELVISKIASAIHFNTEGQAQIDALPKDALIVFQCRSGARSLQAAKHYAIKGYSNLYNLVGGINAWAAEIDSTMKQY